MQTPPLVLALLALAAGALLTGCTPYSAANDSNPAARGASTGSSHGSGTPHSH